MTLGPGVGGSRKGQTGVPLDALTFGRFDVRMFGRSDVWTFRRLDVRTFGCLDVHSFGCSDVQMFVRLLGRMEIPPSVL